MSAALITFLLAAALGAFAGAVLGLRITDWRFWVLIVIASGMHLTGRAA